MRFLRGIFKQSDFLVLNSVAEPEPVEPKLFRDLEPEPKINLTGFKINFSRFYFTIFVYLYQANQLGDRSYSRYSRQRSSLREHQVGGQICIYICTHKNERYFFIKVSNWLLSLANCYPYEKALVF